MLRSWDADKGELVCHCDLKCSVRGERAPAPGPRLWLVQLRLRSGDGLSWLEDGTMDILRRFQIKPGIRYFDTYHFTKYRTYRGQGRNLSICILYWIVRAAVLPSVKVIRYSCDQSGNKKIISQSRIELMFYYFGLELPFGHQCSHSQLNSVTSL